MNTITILQPRWHDRKVLVADWKIASDNQIIIKHSDFPAPFYMSGGKLRTYPIQSIKTKQGNEANMRVIPISDLSTDLRIEEL